MNKLSIIIEKEGHYYRNFWVKRSNKQVVGTQQIGKYIIEAIPNAENGHWHFSYFCDGNYHFTLTYFDTKQKIYVERRLYNQGFVLKKSTIKNFSQIQGEGFKRDPDAFIDSFMMNEPIKAWNDIPFGHTFGTTALRFPEATVSHFGEEIKADESTENNLLIKFDDHPNSIINLGASFYSKGNPHFEFKALPNNITLKKCTQEKGGICLSVYAIIISN